MKTTFEFAEEPNPNTLELFSPNGKLEEGKDFEMHGKIIEIKDRVCPKHSVIMRPSYEDFWFCKKCYDEECPHGPIPMTGPGLWSQSMIDDYKKKNEGEF